MLKGISNKLGITVETTEPPAQPRAPAAYKLQELLRDSERTQPAANIARWPVDQQLRVVERALRNLRDAEMASERCMLHLSECQKMEAEKKRDLEREQDKLYREIRDAGAFDRRGDLPEWMRMALMPPAEAGDDAQ